MILAYLRRRHFLVDIGYLKFKNHSSTAASVPSALHVYNSLTKTKSQLATRYPGVLSWYVCGPTVYDSSHIGHAWCYVNFDIMRRVMENYFNFTVMQVMNITDIDDKIINKALDHKVDFREIASIYEADFFSDLSSLSVKKPTLVTRVSDFIPQIISFIEALLKDNMAYKTDDGSVYFNLSVYSENYKYGKLKAVTLEQPSAKNESYSNSKKNDFALWKAAKSSSEPGWEPSWGGRGRPGWHIECSVMASCIFGSWVDVHSGGIDLLFPHHENEEAQCCAFHKKPQWVGHWIHTNLLHSAGGTKMSKSLKNFVTVKEFLQSHSADEFRMMCLLSSYRNGMDFTEASLKLASDTLSMIKNFISDCQYFLRTSHSSSSVSKQLDSTLLMNALFETKSTIENHLSDDFNTAQATAAVRKLVQMAHKELQKSPPTVNVLACISDFVVKYFSSLGFTSFENSTTKEVFETNTSYIIDDFIEFRSQVRQQALKLKHAKDAKNEEVSSMMETKKILLTACDNLREAVGRKGILLKDQEKKTTWTTQIK